ncbi:MAG: zinc-ribbon domain-containing protein [Clostridia bacterium]|nr:zinc-ribbon domain-containing protein [Clostridia bacterium]
MNSVNNALLIRRFIAIGLVVLSLVCLFWPSVLGLRPGDYRDQSVDAYKEQKKQVREMERDKDEGVEVYESNGFSPADAKKYVNAYISYLYIAIKPDISFSDLRTMMTASLTRTDLEDKYGIYSYESFSEEQKEDHVISVVFTILINVVFWGMLLFGVGAIVLMVLNKSKVLNVLLAVFAFLAVALAVFMIIYSNVQTNNVEDASQNPIAPGAGLFLIPIFALAACILYKQDKSYRGAFPARTAPARADEQPPVNHTWNAAPQQPLNPWASAPQQPSNPQWGAQQPSNPQWGAQQPRQGAWSDVSGWGEQPQSAPQQPQAEVPTWTCPVCGTKNPTTVEFCPNCGTKQE